MLSKLCSISPIGKCFSPSPTSTNQLGVYTRAHSLLYVRCFNCKQTYQTIIHSHALHALFVSSRSLFLTRQRIVVTKVRHYYGPSIRDQAQFHFECSTVKYTIYAHAFTTGKKIPNVRAPLIISIPRLLCKQKKNL